MSNEVELEFFCKKYGRTVAANGVNLKAGTGGITAILGRNGAGKTSVLKGIAGLHYATSGLVRVLGEEEPNLIRRFTSFVPETPSLDLELTVKETLFFEAEVFGLGKNEANSAIEEAVSVCDLSSVMGKKVRTLSKGFQQRTSLAKALCRKPRVLVLDEFSAGLDPAQNAAFRKELKRLSQSITVIFSTHLIEEAETLCGTIYIMSQGKVISFGTSPSIIKESGSKTLEEAFISLTKSDSESFKIEEE